MATQAQRIARLSVSWAVLIVCTALVAVVLLEVVAWIVFGRWGVFSLWHLVDGR